MAIFSMLFGAGVVLMAERREAVSKRPAGLHYRRMLWLLLFGAAHGWLLWYGDILFTYAVCGLWIYLLRNRSPRTLIIVGIIVVSVSSAVSLFWQFTMPWWPPGQIEQMNDDWWSPPPESVAEENAAYRGSWAEQQTYRGPATLFMETFVLLTSMVWRCGGLMLIGMALYKLGYLSAKRDDASYWRLIAAAVLIGVPLIAAGVVYREATDWDVRTGFMGGSQFNYWGSIPVALGWIAAVMLVCRHGLFPRLTGVLAAAGRMALSCYLLQTIICTAIFYGHGLGCYGSVSRTEQIGITLAVWFALLLYCRWWLDRFRFGPFEWVWRSLTYWRLQPLRR
jgi:uncharacterized protein